MLVVSPAEKLDDLTAAVDEIEFLPAEPRVLLESETTNDLRLPFFELSLARSNLSRRNTKWEIGSIIGRHAFAAVIAEETSLSHRNKNQQ